MLVFMSREKVILQLVSVFRQYGYEGTSLAMLSKVTGLGKASLYHYFPKGKKGMADAVMEHVASSFKEKILQPLSNTDPPQKKIINMRRALNEFYANGTNNCFLAIMSVGEADSLFHNQVKHRLEIWINAIAQVLITAGIEPQNARERSQDAIAEIQGALILVRILDEPEIFARIIEKLPEKLIPTA